ncbi:hypothetical protein BDK51DRAFT_52307 [Blyttiomyces helicus]|uniref:Uncharacterized protein n=1 Tax=Blyttiomyces helicus TaxID=388810 RepID=A0A4P9VY63_9FUNG|nr:hypothetical protein BDK51DRAFT_52307 [Blyttiomyces helicus]|eukprot:RKO84699.1 hypothetical protein BDK51DRAFT_52307 [Blyttiomyces helicus]
MPNENSYAPYYRPSVAARSPHEMYSAYMFPTPPGEAAPVHRASAYMFPTPPGAAAPVHRAEVFVYSGAAAK